MVVDRDVDELPTRRPAQAPVRAALAGGASAPEAPVAGDPVAGDLDAPQLLDVDWMSSPGRRRS